MITCGLRWCLRRCSLPVCAPPTNLGRKTGAEESLFAQIRFFAQKKDKDILFDFT